MKPTSISRLGKFIVTAALVAFFVAGGAHAGFTGTDLFLPGAARSGGVGGSEFYTTVWVTNVSAAPATIHIGLLLLGSANPMPVTKSDVIPATARR